MGTLPLQLNFNCGTIKTQINSLHSQPAFSNIQIFHFLSHHFPVGSQLPNLKTKEMLLVRLG